jgi:hypothetical protein
LRTNNAERSVVTAFRTVDNTDCDCPLVGAQPSVAGSSAIGGPGLKDTGRGGAAIRPDSLDEYGTGVTRSDSASVAPPPDRAQGWARTGAPRLRHQAEAWERRVEVRAAQQALHRAEALDPPEAPGPRPMVETRHEAIRRPAARGAEARSPER